MTASKEPFLRFIKKFEEKNLSLCFQIEYLDCFIERIKTHPVSVIFLYGDDDFSESFCSCLTQEFLNNVNFLGWDISTLDETESLVKDLKNVNDQVVDELMLDCIAKGRGAFFLFCFKDDKFDLKAYFTREFSLNDFIRECCNERTKISRDIFNKEEVVMKLRDLRVYGIKEAKKLSSAYKNGDLQDKLVLIYFHNRNGVFSKSLWKLIQNREANLIFNQFIFYVHNQSKHEILSIMYKLNLDKDLRGFNGILIIQSDEMGVKLMDNISGNMNQEEIMNKLCDAQCLYRSYIDPILLSKEEDLNVKSFQTYSELFPQSGFSIEISSLKNAFSNCIYNETGYQKKVVILCLYTNKNIRRLFSTILKDDDLKKQLSLLYHIVLWNVDEESNIKVFKTALRNMHLENNIANVIEQSLNVKKDISFVFGSDDEDLVQLFMTVKEFNYNELDLKDIFNDITKEFIKMFDMTDFVELEAIKNVPYNNCNGYLSMVCKEPLGRLIPEILVNDDPGKVLALNICTERTKMVESFKTIPQDSKVISWLVNQKNAKKLALAADRYFKNDSITSAVKNQSENTFIFILTGCGMVFLSDTKILNTAVNMISVTKNLEQSSFMYQQIMAERLGNRDFDEFDMENSEEKESFNDWVGIALFGLPTDVEEKYNKNQKKSISEMVDQIKKQVEKYSPDPQHIRVACIFNCFVPEEESLDKFRAMPVISLQKCVNSPGRSCRIFIDHNLRVFTSWEGYLDENTLPAGVNIVPKDGIYQLDCFGQVCLELIRDLKIGTKIVNGIDIATMVAGLCSAAIGVAALIPAITVAPFIAVGAGFVGAGTGVYSVVRSATNLADRAKHEQSLNIKNQQARSAYLNMAAGLASFATIGATVVISRVASSGKTIPKASQIAFNCLSGGNIAVSGTSLANSLVDVIYNWKVNGEAPDPLTSVQLVASVLFFGHSIYNVRSAGTIINESQQQTLKNIENSLKSNRQRKTFQKLVKETVRVNEGNVQKGRAEVISTLKNIDNVHETMAILTRNNKYFNKNKIRFSADQNKITLNGSEVDLKTFSDLSNIEKSQVYNDLPPMREFNVINQNDFNFSDAVTVVTYGQEAAGIAVKLYNKDYEELKRLFSDGVCTLLMKFVKMFFEYKNINTSMMNSSVLSILVNESVILRMIINFFEIKGFDRMKQFCKEKNWKSLNKIIVFIEQAVYLASSTPEMLMRDLSKFSVTWVANKIIDSAPENKNVIVTDFCECNICHGYLKPSKQLKRKHT